MARKYGKIAENILLTLATAGLFAVAATSPYFFTNIARGIIRNKKFNGYREKSRHNDGFYIQKISRSLAGLSKNKIIILKESDGKFYAKLTGAGKRVVKEIEFENMKIEKPKIWDKKWRIIIFDIPERQKRIGRDALRSKLQILGFYQVQKSVWVFSYPCEKEVQLLCEIFEISPFVNIITADSIYNDDSIKKYFNL